MNSFSRKRERQEADLDITPFMNLMIVLVPVLLLSMVFTRITVIDIQLPLAAGESSEQIAQKQAEVVIGPDALRINFPEGTLLRKIDHIESGSGAQNTLPNYAELSLVLQALKRELQAKGADRKNINLLVPNETPYHIIVSTMDAVRSFQAVIAADVVEAELFPEVAFGEAPVKNKQASSYPRLNATLGQGVAG